MKNLFLSCVVAFSVSSAVNGQMLLKPPESKKADQAGSYSELMIKNHRLMCHPEKMPSLNQNQGTLTPKHSLVVKHRLDSLIKKIQEPFKSPLSLINEERILFYYDINQFQTHEVSYRWENGAGHWSPDTKTEFGYDAFGQVTSYTDSNWDLIGNQWVLDYKYEFEYDANGNVIAETQYAYVDSISSWSPTYKMEYTWSANGVISLMTESIYNSGLAVWEYTYKSEYQYTATWQTEVETDYFWDTDSSNWISQYKYEFSYDGSDRLILSMEFTWNELENLWNESYKNEYSYNTGDLLIMKMRYEYNFPSWVTTDRTEYDYDVNGNMILRDYYFFDSWSSTWYNFTKDHLDHNLNYSQTDLIVPTTWWWFGEPSHNMLTARYGEENYNGSSWIDSYRYDYFYNEVNITGINPVMTVASLVYPNPASDQVRISWENNDLYRQFALFDNTGRKVVDRILTNEAVVDVNQLPKGLYYFTLKSEKNAMVTGKITVQ